MTPTEIKLLAIHKGPIIPLAEISKRYLGRSPQEAARLAATNQLPFPAFRLRDSFKSPLMVKVEDLARHIDTVAECAKESWENSQV